MLTHGAKKRFVPKFNPTRWSMRVDTLSTMLAKYQHVLYAVDQIALQSAVEGQGNAISYARSLDDPEFIVSLVVTQYILSFFSSSFKIPSSKRMQSEHGLYRGRDNTVLHCRSTK